MFWQASSNYEAERIKAVFPKAKTFVAPNMPAKTLPTLPNIAQNSKETVAELAKRFNVNPKTIQKWKKRNFTEDAKYGPKKVNTVLTELEEQIICEFRRKTKLSIDDVFISLKDKIPKLGLSNLYRCLKRHA